MNRDYENKLEELKNIAEVCMPKLPYHNYAHVVDVADACKRLAILEGNSDEEIFLLQSAAYLHDRVYNVGRNDNEGMSAALAGVLLREMHYKSKQIPVIYDLILATKLPTNPQNKLEQIICDADLDNLGREDFLERNELLRKELGLPSNADWYYKTLGFLQEHRYYTDSAKKLRQAGLQNNIAKLKEIINNFPR